MTWQMVPEGENGWQWGNPDTGQTARPNLLGYDPAVFGLLDQAAQNLGLSNPDYVELAKGIIARDNINGGRGFTQGANAADIANNLIREASLSPKYSAAFAGMSPAELKQIQNAGFANGNGFYDPSGQVYQNLQQAGFQREDKLRADNATAGAANNSFGGGGLGGAAKILGAMAGGANAFSALGAGSVGTGGLYNQAAIDAAEAATGGGNLDAALTQGFNAGTAAGQAGGTQLASAAGATDAGAAGIGGVSSSPDAIEYMLKAAEATGQTTATGTAKALGFSTVGDMLASVNPAWVSAGAAAAGAGASLLGAAKDVAPYAAMAAPVVGGLISANAANKAADIQAGATNQASQAATDAGNNAIAEQRRQFDLTRSDLAPYREAGTTALASLKSLMAGGSLTRPFTLDDFWSDPVTKASYQSGLDLGTKAIGNMAGARGGKNSGATLKALDRFGVDYTGGQAAASQARFVGDQNNTFNKQAAMAGIGQAATNTSANAGANAATNIGNIGTTTANTVGNLLTSGANARGAAAIAGSNALSGGLNSVSNWWNSQQNLDKILNSGSVRGLYGA